MQEIIHFIQQNIQMVYIVILMIFLGIEIIGRVPSVLHTPSDEWRQCNSRRSNYRRNHSNGQSRKWKLCGAGTWFPGCGIGNIKCCWRICGD